MEVTRCAYLVKAGCRASTGNDCISGMILRSRCSNYSVEPRESAGLLKEGLMNSSIICQMMIAIRRLASRIGTRKQALLPFVLLGWFAAATPVHSTPVEADEKFLNLELGPYQGMANRVAFDDSGDAWIATKHTLYQIRDGKLSVAESRVDETLQLAPGNGVHAWLRARKYGRFDFGVVATPTMKIGALFQHERSGFDGLYLGRKAQAIVTTSPLDNREGGHGPVEYVFWSLEGNAVGRTTLAQRSIGILDPNGTTLLLLGDTDARSFSAKGVNQWRYAGRYRKGAVSENGAIALLNPRDSIWKVHLIGQGKKMTVIELPSPVHHLALAADGSVGAIAVDKGGVFLVDTTSGKLTEVTLPLVGVHFVTDIRFLDSTTITLGLILAADEGPDKFGRFSFQKASVMAISIGGDLEFRQDFTLDQPDVFAPLIDVAYGTKQFAGRAGHRVLIVRLGPHPARPPKPKLHLEAVPLSRLMEWRKMHSGPTSPPAPPALVHGWPIEPSDQAHALGNTFGEFEHFSTHGVSQHAGIDVLAIPFDSGPATPWVVATVGGAVTCTHYGGVTLSNECNIEGDDGISYKYLHLHYDSETDLGSGGADSAIHVNNGSHINAGGKIAYVEEFPLPDGVFFNHLHYELTRGDKRINPLRDITPLADYERPVISSVGFGKHNSDPWESFPIEGDPPCHVVSGKVSIVAKVADLDNAATCTLGIYRLRWKACPDSDPNCAMAWKPMYMFDEMQKDWSDLPGNAMSEAQFSSRRNHLGDWESTWDYCTKTVFMIPTNWIPKSGSVNDEPSVDGAWETVGTGRYLITIEATDFADNVGLKTENVCVSN